MNSRFRQINFKFAEIACYIHSNINGYDLLDELILSGYIDGFDDLDNLRKQNIIKHDMAIAIKLFKKHWASHAYIPPETNDKTIETLRAQFPNVTTSSHVNYSSNAPDLISEY